MLILIGCLEIQGNRWKHLAKQISSEIQKQDKSYLSSSNKYNYPIDDNQGIVMCAGNKMVPDILRMLWQVRIIWKSNIKFAINHCSELQESVITFLKEVDPNIQVIDICKPDVNNLVYGMNPAEASYRLKGFYCKVAALIESPFDQTMLIDLDVVWFKSPLKLFHSTYFTSKGLLFFRDRHAFDLQEISKNIQERKELILNFFHRNKVIINEQTTSNHYLNDGISEFWRCLDAWNPSDESIKERFPCLQDYQDSSVVMLHKSKHPHFLSLLKQYVASISIGYGDKETYWIVASISNEPFLFEPFLAGQYGDCGGVIVHYDPDDALTYQNTPNNHSISLLPFYMNGEFTVESKGKLQSIGEFLIDVMTAPILATKDMLPPKNPRVFGNSYGKRQCVCGVITCIPTLYEMNRLIVYNQWITMSLQHVPYDHTMNTLIKSSLLTPSTTHSMSGMSSSTLQNQHCMIILGQAIPYLNDIFTQEILSWQCNILGCPYLPIKLTIPINDTNAWTPGYARICDPIFYHQNISSFSSIMFGSNHHDTLIKHIQQVRQPSTEYSAPIIKTNQLIICPGEREVYVLSHDQQFHGFPNLKTFVKMGFDFSQVKKVSMNFCQSITFGNLLPDLS